MCSILVLTFVLYFTRIIKLYLNTNCEIFWGGRGGGDGNECGVIQLQETLFLIRSRPQHCGYLSMSTPILHKYTKKPPNSNISLHYNDGRSSMDQDPPVRIYHLIQSMLQKEELCHNYWKSFLIISSIHQFIVGYSVCIPSTYHARFA